MKTYVSRHTHEKEKTICRKMLKWEIRFAAKVSEIMLVRGFRWGFDLIFISAFGIILYYTILYLEGGVESRSRIKMIRMEVKGMNCRQMMKSSTALAFRWLIGQRTKVPKCGNPRGNYSISGEQIKLFIWMFNISFKFIFSVIILRPSSKIKGSRSYFNYP